MNYDELAFMNQQLAGMLKSGIPLEGALRQLAEGMRRGELKDELQRLEADLAQGVPLERAIEGRNLPPFYKAMVRVGAQSHDLPGVLLLLADYYHRFHSNATRVKGLMFYPVVVLLAGFGVSLVLSLIFSRLVREFASAVDAPFGMPPLGLFAVIWLPPSALALALAVLVIALILPGGRARIRWRIPAFRESSLAELAAALALLLERGTPLPDALQLMREVEGDSPAGRELGEWQRQLASGHGKLEQFAQTSRAFPPVFLWLAAQGGPDLAAGFRKAAEVFNTRAVYRLELVLYAFLPVSVLLLGLMIIGQVLPVTRWLGGLMQSLGGLE